MVSNVTHFSHLNGMTGGTVVSKQKSLGKKFQAYLPLIVISCGIWPSLGFALGLNDVSVLLPLPKNEAEQSTLLDPIGDNLVPAEILQMLPAPVLNDHEPQRRRDQMRVLGIRFDPCFAEGLPPFKCRHQIRLIFQPVSFFEAQPMTVDAAMHGFYEFEDSEWAEIVAAWKAQVTDSPASALQIHPVVRSEGLQGPYWMQLRELILKHCSHRSLRRVTSMSVNLFGAFWTFRGFDISENGEAKAITIAETSQHTTQSFVTDIDRLQEFKSRIFPKPENEDLWMTFVQDSRGAKEQLSGDQLQRVMVRATEFENPLKFNPGTRDCVSCHIAQTVRLWGESNVPHLAGNLQMLGARFASPFPLENKSVNAFNANRLRAFGYFLDEPIFSQRVINESAAVAEAMARE